MQSKREDLRGVNSTARTAQGTNDPSSVEGEKRPEVHED